MDRDKERAKLLEELAQLDPLPQPEQDATDDTANCGYTPTPILADHWSVTPEWKRLRASMTEPEPEPSNVEPTEVPKEDWYGHAASLAGCTDEEPS